MFIVLLARKSTFLATGQQPERCKNNWPFEDASIRASSHLLSYLLSHLLSHLRSCVSINASSCAAFVIHSSIFVWIYVCIRWVIHVSICSFTYSFNVISQMKIFVVGEYFGNLFEILRSGLRSRFRDFDTKCDITPHVIFDHFCDSFSTLTDSWHYLRYHQR
jgi:hypothetical protein